MNGTSTDQRISGKCVIDFVLMGTFEPDELLSFYNTSVNSLSTDEWRINWFEDIGKITSTKLEKIEPHEYYERIYNLRGIGMLSVEKAHTTMLFMP